MRQHEFLHSTVAQKTKTSANKEGKKKIQQKATSSWYVQLEFYRPHPKQLNRTQC
jgi:hypothetical protein